MGALWCPPRAQVRCRRLRRIESTRDDPRDRVHARATGHDSGQQSRSGRARLDKRTLRVHGDTVPEDADLVEVTVVAEGMPPITRVTSVAVIVA